VKLNMLHHECSFLDLFHCEHYTLHPFTCSVTNIHMFSAGNLGHSHQLIIFSSKHLGQQHTELLAVFQNRVRISVRYGN
jgi:hypothetical protein